MPHYRRRGNNLTGVVVLGVVAITTLVFLLKTLLITAAILAVPFGVWWLWDHEQRKNAAAAAKRSDAPRVDPVAEAIRADDLGLADSVAYWRSHYGPSGHDEETRRRRDRTTAANQLAVQEERTRRIEEGRARVYARIAEQQRRDRERGRA